MGGENKQSRGLVDDTTIDAFLEKFDGDVMAAMRALQRRGYLPHKHEAQKSETSKPKKDVKTGPVVIAVHDLKKQYKIGKQSVQALNGVTLDIHEGEFVAFTGASGSGKSTLLQLMGGLDRPSSGVVEVGGVDLTKMSDGKLSEYRGKTIGFVFQFFYLQPFLKLGRNLEVPGMFTRTKAEVRRQRVAELVQSVGLDERIDHLPKELSGGQMQRAAIARALLNNPKVILADEPTGNLDSVNSQAVMDLFEQVRREFGTTIVIVTHDKAIAERADREIVLKDGVIV